MEKKLLLIYDQKRVISMNLSLTLLAKGKTYSKGKLLLETFLKSDV